MARSTSTPTSPSLSASSTTVEKNLPNLNFNPDTDPDPDPDRDLPDELEKRYYSHKADNEMAMASTGVPRRKPVPLPKDVQVEGEMNRGVISGETGFTGATFMEKIKLKLGLLDTNSKGEEIKKKKRLIIIAIVVGVVVLLALVIGLAVGLTVGKQNDKSNLPLPTGNGGPYSGDLTYYQPALGACGITSSSSEAICAVSKDLYDAASTGSDPNQNPLCGLKIRLRRDGKSVDVTVVDRCVGCKPTDIDVSMSVFEKLAVVEQGRVNVDWAWIDKAPVSVS